jgi:hypothetical protein
LKKEEDREAKIEAAEAAMHLLTESLLNCKVREEDLLRSLTQQGQLKLQQQGEADALSRTQQVLDESIAAAEALQQAAPSNRLPMKSAAHLDQCLLHAVASIDDRWEDQHLERTLLAARLHR